MRAGSYIWQSKPEVKAQSPFPDHCGAHWQIPVFDAEELLTTTHSPWPLQVDVGVAGNSPQEGELIRVVLDLSKISIYAYVCAYVKQSGFAGGQ